MAENNSVGSNRLLYSIIGVLGGIVAVGGFIIFGGTVLPSDKAKPAESPATVAQTTTPAPAPAPPPAPMPPAAASNSDLNALALSIDRAIAASDFTYADSLLADANRRYAGNGAWPSLQQKLARARTDRDTRMRQAEARRLIAEARSFAQAGDFADAEEMLQEADKQMPGFAETGQTRGDIASMRTERGRLYRERYQYTAAIDQAFTADRLWEAERLLADYSRHFDQDDDYRVRSNRLAEMRAAATWQARLNQSRSFIANARQAMERGDFVEAERQLVLADQAAPGFPEIDKARADLSRRRIAAEQQQDGIRLILAAIDAAFQRKQYDDAEHAIEDGRRRYGSYSGWADLQRRNASARQGNDQQANDFRQRNAHALELVAGARRSTAQGDFAAAERALNEANTVFTDMPEAITARAELERARADRARQDAESRAMAASVDAALARRQYADAERLIGDGTRRYPSYAGWTDLSRRLVESRQAAPGQTGNAPMSGRTAPAPSAAPGPATTGLPAASLPAPAPNVANVPAAAHARLQALVATARDAIKRSDFTTAEKAVAEAERLDVKAASTVEIRTELKTAEARQNTRALELVTAARRSIAQGDFATADRTLADAKTISVDMPEIANAHAELERAKADRARQDSEIRAMTASADAALARHQYADAERLIADGTKRYPSYAGWADLSRRLTEARRAAPNQIGTAPTPALVAPVQTPPAPRPSPTANTPASNTAAAPAANAQLPQLVATAHDAIIRSDFTAAEKAVTEAERLDTKAASTVGIRAELRAALEKSKAPPVPVVAPTPPPTANARPTVPASATSPADNRATIPTPSTAPAATAPAPATITATAPALPPQLPQLVAAARDAIKRTDFVAAANTLAKAEKLDAKAASVVQVRAELQAALLRQHVAVARDAIKRSEFAVAEENVAEAEKLDAKAASVVEIREELKAAQGKSKDKMPPASRK